jgi:hypothetical protein
MLMLMDKIAFFRPYISSIKIVRAGSTMFLL